jgi:Flp pilus assembly protein TadG
VSRGRGPRARDRGTATVEFAIVVPLLLLLAFGIIDFGRMASDHVQLSAAARAAAQAVAAGQSASAGTVASNVFRGGGTVTVRIDRSCGPAPQPGEVAQVTVTHTFTFATPVAALAKLAKSPTMTVQAAAPCRA